MSRRKGGAQTSQMLETAERRAFVLELRRMGTPYADIARAAMTRFGKDRLPKGWDERYAYKDVSRELARVRRDVGESALEVLTMELQRLDEMFLGLWRRSIKGDTLAVDRALKIMERRAKLLGLDDFDLGEGEEGEEIKTPRVRTVFFNMGGMPDDDGE